MMKSIISSILLVLCAALFGQESDSISDQFLIENLRPIDQQLLESGQSKVFNFLEAELAGVEILLLGEQGHGDGYTFTMKTELIKYLHENQGFNVIAFESGMMDCYRVWEAIQNGADSLAVFDLGIFPIWSKSNQVKPLFEYILEQSRTDNPLILAGFDMQPTGSLMKPKDRFKEIDAYLKSTLAEDWNHSYPLVHSTYSDISQVFRSPLSIHELDLLKGEIQRLTSAIRERGKEIKDLVMAQYLENLLSTIFLYAKADLKKPSNTPHVFNIRDKRMAENFSLLKEKLYPEEKIIGWGANTHFGFGRGLLGSFDGRSAPQQGMVPAGQYLKIDYQQKVYTLAFTSRSAQYGRMNADPVDLPKAKKGSLEEQIHRLGYDLAYLNLRNELLLGKRFVLRAYGHSEMSGIWSNMADGLIYIDQNTPNTFYE